MWPFAAERRRHGTADRKAEKIRPEEKLVKNFRNSKKKRHDFLLKTMSFFALHVDEVQRTYRLFIIIIYRFFIPCFRSNSKTV